MTIAALMKTETLKLVYFACYDSIVAYGITFWGNSMNSKKVFYIEKKWQALKGASCRELFKKF
jgi:hypothetical protein